MTKEFEQTLATKTKELVDERYELHNQKKTMEQIEQELVIQDMKLEALRKFRQH